MKKKDVIEFFKRGLIFGGFGPIIAGLILFIISIYINIEKSDIFSFMRTVKGKLFNTKGVNVFIFYMMIFL